jgi:hypothetical protein
MPKFSDIHQLTRTPSYCTDIDWADIDWWIENQSTKGPVDLDPDFQRGHVWSPAQQRAYIEYCLRNGMTNNRILWNNPGHSGGKGEYNLVLVDGKQRLEAIRAFLNDEFAVFDSLYSQYEGTLPTPACTLKFCINDLESRPEILTWYIEMNSGGTPHTEEELARVHTLFLKSIRENL